MNKVSPHHTWNKLGHLAINGQDFFKMTLFAESFAIWRRGGGEGVQDSAKQSQKT